MPRLTTDVTYIVLHVSACLTVQRTAHTTSYSRPHQLLPVADVQLRHERRLVWSRPLRSAGQPCRHHDRLAPKSGTPNYQFFAIELTYVIRRFSKSSGNKTTGQYQMMMMMMMMIMMMCNDLM